MTDSPDPQPETFAPNDPPTEHPAPKDDAGTTPPATPTTGEPPRRNRHVPGDDDD